MSDCFVKQTTCNTSIDLCSRTSFRHYKQKATVTRVHINYHTFRIYSYRIQLPKRGAFWDPDRCSQPVHRWWPIARVLGDLLLDTGRRPRRRRHTFEPRSGADWRRDSPYLTGEHRAMTGRRSDASVHILIVTESIHKHINKRPAFYWTVKIQN